MGRVSEMIVVIIYFVLLFPREILAGTRPMDLMVILSGRACWSKQFMFIFQKLYKMRILFLAKNDVQAQAIEFSEKVGTGL